jgi:uncharacterized protein YdaL
MSTPRLWRVVFAALMALAAAAHAAIASPASVFTNSALILYDGPAEHGEGLLLARHVANLMGHFSFRAEVKPISSYAPGQAEAFNALFVCGMADATVIPTSLLTDVERRQKITVWVHLHLGQLTTRTNVAANLGFTYLENDDETALPLVHYRGFKLPRTEAADIDRVTILNRDKVQILATAEDEDEEPTESTPYVLRSGQFWYFAGPGFSFETESDASLVLADLLHDILGVAHAPERRALARIEDVSADSDPEELRRVADVLGSRRIPFQIALIPQFRDPVKHLNLSLSDEPEVVAAIRYMVSRGGTVVMHGVTHQFHGVSGDDYEFWDTVANRPTPDGAPAVLEPRLLRGLDSCFSAGFYPLIFETPHYGASLEHYRSLASVFSHCYERRILCEQDDTVEFCPFLTRDVFGATIIPENLGYVPEEKPDAQPVIEAAHRLLAVRDPVASFYFHPFMPAKYLEQILSSIQRDGYRFVSVKDFAPEMALGDYAAVSRPRTLTITPRLPYLKTTRLNAAGEITEHVQPVQPGKPVTIALEPPTNGLAAVQSVAQPLLAQPRTEPGLWQRFTARLHPSRSLPTSTVQAHQALILGPSPAYESALGVYGIPCRRLDPMHAIPDDAFVVIPRNAPLTEAARERLVRWVSRGGRLLLEGRTPLAEQLGFQFSGGTFAPSRLQDYLSPDVPIKWPGTVEVERFMPPSVSTTLMAEDATGFPVAAAARVGSGVAIYLGAELDPETGLGYTRFPFLFQHLRQRFAAEPQATADGIEFYFDPGFRERSSTEELVKAWHNEGVRAIYAAAWHFYPNWKFDYDRLIRLCHAEGIAVYAWLELPSVTPQFWEAHPEWRERTATGRDGEVGWRKFMNFANPACRAAALRFADELLDQHDWDGVNLAELCFDTESLEKPDSYIPMNQEVRELFQKQSGFDPLLLFDESSPHAWRKNPEGRKRWARFRTTLTRDWLAETLEHLAKRRLDVIVTALDSLSSPDVIEKNGCDSRDVVALMSRYNFTLQVEDAADLWGESPVRYLDFGKVYRQLVAQPSRLMFDINVVKDRSHGKAPTAQACGVELALTVRAAAEAGNGRVGIYSESTVQLEDRGLLPIVMGAGTTVVGQTNGLAIAARRPVWFHVAAPTARASWWDFWTGGPSPRTETVPVLDGQPWFFGSKGIVLLGEGEHVLPVREVAPQRHTIRVRDISTSFTNLTSTKGGFSFDYDSSRRAWMRLSREPSQVLADGQPLADAARRSGRDYLVTLPPGRHRAEVQAATTVAVAVEDIGEHSLESIVWLGTRGVLFLGLLYALTRLRRVWLRLTRNRPART